MDKLFKKWEWKWTANESIREILYFFENDKKMVLELKEKRLNGEKRCEWMIFNKENEKIEPLAFKSMSENRRQFDGEITLEWNKKEAILSQENNKEVLAVRMARWFFLVLVDI